MTLGRLLISIGSPGPFQSPTQPADPQINLYLRDQRSPHKGRLPGTKRFLQRFRELSWKVLIFLLLSERRRRWRRAWAAGSSPACPPPAGGCCCCPTRTPHTSQTPPAPRPSGCCPDSRRCESSRRPSCRPGAAGEDGKGSHDQEMDAITE